MNTKLSSSPIDYVMLLVRLYDVQGYADDMMLTTWGSWSREGHQSLFILIQLAPDNIQIWSQTNTGITTYYSDFYRNGEAQAELWF